VVVAQYEGTAKPKHVEVKTCESSIPETVAESIHGAWLTMLSRVDSAPDRLVLDSTREIFVARSPNGQLLRGRLPLTAELGKNTKQLYEIANLLYRCCSATEAERVRDFILIDKLATGLRHAKK